MNRARNVVLLALVCLAAVGAQAQEWRGPASIAIEVKGKPSGNVADALVILRYQQIEPPAGPRPVLTDAAGRAVLVDLAEGVWEVEVSHDDFLSFVALVFLDSRRKPEVQASFLQASGSSLTPIRVKIASGKGKSPSVSVPLPPEAAERLAQRRPLSPPRPPAASATPEPARRPAKSPQSVIPEPELRPLPEAARPAETPAPPALAEAAPPRPEPQMSEPEPAPPTPEPGILPEPRPSSTVIEPAAPPEPKPAPPAAEAVTAPEPEPVSPPRAEPAPAPTAPISQPRPVPTPEPMPQPTPTPTPVPAMPEPATPPVSGPAPPMPTPPTPPAPPEAEPEPTMPEPKPEPPIPEPESEPAMPEPELAPAVTEPASQPQPEPPPKPATPEPSPLPRNAVSAQPELLAAPEPPPAPAPTVVLEAPGPLGPTLRAYRDRTCIECRPGEWAISVEVVVGPTVAPCDQTLDATGRELATLLGGSVALELKEIAASAAQAVGELESAETAARIADLLGDDSRACRVVAAVIPKAGRFRGLRMEAADASGVGDCQADRPCPVGRARWIGQPRVSREPSANVIWGLFVNEAADRARRARLTVYFAAPYRAWDPAR